MTMRAHPIAVNFRGTSGSGKTTLAREVMKLYELPSSTCFREKRKRPIMTLHMPKRPGRLLAVLGHYEAACGGCDTITELDDVFGLVREQLGQGHNVMFEGLILSGEIIRTEKLVMDHELHILALTTPVADCIANVSARRVARGAPAEFKHKNTTAKARCVELTMNRLQPTVVAAANGGEAVWMSFDQALLRTRELLGV